MSYRVRIVIIILDLAVLPYLKITFSAFDVLNLIIISEVLVTVNIDMEC